MYSLKLTGLFSSIRGICLSLIELAMRESKGGNCMFYRRKFYTVKNDFVDAFNEHFNKTNLPNQLKYGARLVGRWMKDNKDNTTEIFAIWEYDSYDNYIEIENKVKGDSAHVKRITEWYERNGGREHVFKEYIIEVKNEALVSTLNKNNK